VPNLLRSVGWFTAILGLTLILGSCGKEEMNAKIVADATLRSIPDATWETLSKKKIYFGHQSAGFDAITGIQEIMADNPKIKLKIVQIENGATFDGPGLTHSWIGENGAPESKINDFTILMDQGIGNKADIAFFKFCYVDITSDTDIGKVFGSYKNALDRLGAKYPGITFVHVTVPLTYEKVNLRNLVKKILGRRSILGEKDNIKRNQLNDLLRKEYAGKGLLFDLARAEARLPDGKEVCFNSDGRTYYALAPQYTHDGGHLNEKGRRIVGSELLVFLAKLPQKVI
jgi:hypothetical protein